MGLGLKAWDNEDYDGLPDAAFTEDELAAGVQHIMRTGNPEATSSCRRPVSWSPEPVDDRDGGGDHAEDWGIVMDSSSATTLRFETFAQARAWGQANPGRVITRSSDGHGYEVRPAQQKHSVHSVQRGIDSYDSYMKRSTEIKAMVPHLHDVLSKSASNSTRIFMRPFHRSTWQAELNRLSTSQLKRLRLLVAVHLKDSRNYLRLLYAEMRRFRSMKAGHYGETLREKINEIMEGALADIDKQIFARIDN